MSLLSQRHVVSRAREVGQSLARYFRHNVGPESHTPRTGINPETVASVADALDRHLAMLAETDCWGEANRLPSSAFWTEAAPWLQQGSLQLHARTKPLGYAGDHTMLDRICRNDVAGKGIGRAMDRYFQDHAAPTAVRNRAEVVRDEILRFGARRSWKPMHVVSFGSGPAYDLLLALQEISDRESIQWTLVDMDPRALDFAVQRLRPLVPDGGQIRTVRMNLGRLPRIVENTCPIPPADFLICAGFFDYLRHDEAVAMLRAFRHVLRPDGEWIVFNFGDHNPSQAYMEWIGNWYLRYRDADTMAQIAEDAGLRHVEVDTEPAGVNLYLRGGNA